jgi:hypothetical protein
MDPIPTKSEQLLAHPSAWKRQNPTNYSHAAIAISIEPIILHEITSMYIVMKRTVYCMLLLSFMLSACVGTKKIDRLNRALEKSGSAFNHDFDKFDQAAYENLGNSIADQWDDQVKKATKKLTKSGKSSFISGAISAGISSGSAVAGGLIPQTALKAISYISAAANGFMGIFGMVKNAKPISPAYLVESSAAIAGWSSSSKDQSALKTMATELQRIIGKYKMPGKINY